MAAAIVDAVDRILQASMRLLSMCLQDLRTKLEQLQCNLNGLPGGKFCCPKTVAAKGITSMVNRQPSSASPNVHEAGWAPSWLPGNAFNPVERVIVLQVLFDESTNDVTGSNFCSRQRPSVTVIVVSVHLVLDSASCVLPTGIPQQRHYILMNNHTDETSDKPGPNSAPAINPLHETARTPVAHKHTDQSSEQHSNPNPGVTEPGTFKKAKRSEIWFVATGAAHHATGNRHLFSVFTNPEVENSDLCVHAADGTLLGVCGIGNVVTETVVLPDVWFVPGLDVNLVSVGQLAELDYSIGFARGSCTICNACDTVVGRAHARGDGLYEVDFLEVPLGTP